MISRDSKSVFVSYVRDNSDVVNRICDVFRKNRIVYWLDRDQIEPGKIWKLSIRDAIDNGAFFLACFSDEYEKRSETYMNEELLLGVEILRRKPYNSGWLIPVKLSPCRIPQLDIGAGKTLQDLQYLSFYDDWDREIERLIDIIKREESPIQTEAGRKYIENVYNYQGLKALIETGTGAGFHNADMGHPVYRMGASETSPEVLKEWEYADSPEKSVLYRLLSQLSIELKEAGVEDLRYVWWWDFTEWKDFCRFAIDVYDEKRKRISEGTNNLEHRRNLITSWRKMVLEIVGDYDNEKTISVSKLLERHEDYYSLRPHLSPKTRGEIARIRTVIAGSTISAPLQFMLDDIDRIEKEWHLV